MTAGTLEITDGTKKRLREAMESLVAERGFDAVSVRDITGLAKANVAAVNYHFGSREGLVQHVIESQLRPLIVARHQILTESATRDVIPLLQQWHGSIGAMFADAEENGFHALRMMGRCLEMTYTLPLLAISQEMRAQDVQFQKQMAEAHTVLNLPEIQGKMRFCGGALIHIMIHGHLDHSETPIREQWERWQQCAIGFFTDEILPSKRTKAPKPKSEKKIRMEEAAPSEIGLTPEDPAAPSATPQEEKPPTVAEDDGYGGMFLF